MHAIILWRHSNKIVECSAPHCILLWQALFYKSFTWLQSKLVTLELQLSHDLHDASVACCNWADTFNLLKHKFCSKYFPFLSVFYRLLFCSNNHCFDCCVQFLTECQSANMIQIVLACIQNLSLNRHRHIWGLEAKRMQNYHMNVTLSYMLWMQIGLQFFLFAYLSLIRTRTHTCQ